ncbi:hypothetical protein B0A48_13951 [Cryoendolithus antarcticus]|uniref:Uncharacterized protein n=1 Tax=Cryoendolithus antarcticus TaxID=1507870 RepID=A0A1V8SM60_9PEZI|nr:hypothetical protein B0A48_13951 [Cryoendolithus antarcticus]
MRSNESINEQTNGKENPSTAPARCILIRNGQTGLIHVKAEDYSRLPSGGMEAVDTTQLRDATNATSSYAGCEVEFNSWWLPEGSRPPWTGTLKKESFGYVCDIIELGICTGGHATRGQADGFRWCSPAEAWLLMKRSEPTSEVGELVRRRDIYELAAFLRMHEYP